MLAARWALTASRLKHLLVGSLLIDASTGYTWHHLATVEGAQGSRTQYGEYPLLGTIVPHSAAQ